MDPININKIIDNYKNLNIDVISYEPGINDDEIVLKIKKSNKLKRIYVNALNTLCTLPYASPGASSELLSSRKLDINAANSIEMCLYSTDDAILKEFISFNKTGNVQYKYYSEIDAYANTKVTNEYRRDFFATLFDVNLNELNDNVHYSSLTSSSITSPESLDKLRDINIIANSIAKTVFKGFDKDYINHQVLLASQLDARGTKSTDRKTIPGYFPHEISSQLANFTEKDNYYSLGQIPYTTSQLDLNNHLNITYHVTFIAINIKNKRNYYFINNAILPEMRTYGGRMLRNGRRIINSIYIPLLSTLALEKGFFKEIDTIISKDAWIKKHYNCTNVWDNVEEIYNYLPNFSDFNFSKYMNFLHFIGLADFASIVPNNWIIGTNVEFEQLYNILLPNEIEAQSFQPRLIVMDLETVNEDDSYYTLAEDKRTIVPLEPDPNLVKIKNSTMTTEEWGELLGTNKVVRGLRFTGLRYMPLRAFREEKMSEPI